MEKKEYVKPAMQAFELKQEPQLLVGSGGLNSIPSFLPGGDPVG